MQQKLLQVVLIVLVLISSSPATAQKKATKKQIEKASTLPARICNDTEDVAGLNLIYGAGGEKDAPDPNGSYKFIKEDLKQTSAKFDVEDDHGVRWRVKLGREPQSETAATRLLWAAGYFVDEDYYLAQIKVSGLPKLHRGEKFVTGGEIVHRVRLERHLPDIKKLDMWDWMDNPFIGTRELNGLRVMMALLNNWDLNRDNNWVYETDGRREYVVTDLGAAFGKTGNFFTRSKSRLRDYEHSPFIARETPDSVDFVMHTKPFVAEIVKRRFYRERKSWEQVAKGIPRSDARWLGQRLSQLSDSQIRDCFRAAGYSPAEIDGYAKTVQKRIQQLNSL